MNKTLISYFSASGVTREVAQELSNILNADLFEIEPLKPYTKEDLDWTDKNSRSTYEMENKSSRPKVKNKVENIDNYDTIILGFPVWWYTAPTIVNTFIEENNLKDKIVYIFVTSGSSDSEKSFNDLKETYPEINFISSKRFTTSINKDEVKNWIN